MEVVYDRADPNNNLLTGGRLAPSYVTITLICVSLGLSIFVLISAKSMLSFGSIGGSFENRKVNPTQVDLSAPHPILTIRLVSIVDLNLPN
jgi:hypothetical protein